MRFFLLPCLLAIGCGGAAHEPSGSTTSPGSGQSSPGSTASANDCAPPASMIATSGDTVKQPAGSAQRFQLVYQGNAIGLAQLRGVDKIVGGSDGPFTAGKNAGFWAEVRDASGTTTFTRLLQDPTRLEAPGADGGFTNATRDRCEAKLILVDVPRASAGSALVIFGMPYGAQSAAVELARFTLE